jgi:hypothetical protein
MNFKSISNYIGVALLGGAIGFYVHSRIFQPIQVTLFAGQFSTRLMEDSVALVQLKRNNIPCLRSSLYSRVKSGIDQASFYRQMTTNNSVDLKLVNEAIGTAEQALSSPDQLAKAEEKPCS